MCGNYGRSQSLAYLPRALRPPRPASPHRLEIHTWMVQVKRWKHQTKVLLFAIWKAFHVNLHGEWELGLNVVLWVEMFRINFRGLLFLVDGDFEEINWTLGLLVKWTFNEFSCFWKYIDIFSWIYTVHNMTDKSQISCRQNPLFFFWLRRSL